MNKDLNKRFEDTITNIELDGSQPVFIKGMCKAGDLQRTSNINKYYDSDFCKELNIVRLW